MALWSWTLALIGALAASLAQAQDRPAFVFTAIPDQDESRLVERFTKVAEQLQAKLAVPVKYIPVKSYPAAVTAFTNNQVQLAWFGGFIANAKTGLKPTKEFPKEVAGKSFTFGARASTSGRLMPEFFIRQAFGGKSPEEIFSRVGFSGDHSRTIQLVRSGAFEAGVLDYSVWDLDQKAGKVDPTQVSVIWESPPFPDYQWTIQGDVDATFGTGFIEKVRTVLLSIDDPAILGIFGRTKFIPAKNEDYAPIEEVAKTTGLLN